ncbi:MAG: hypothetical protein JSU03_13395 [Bacteroidetes bacterium]|nr:hypothetical protein [Bacteroidota bacterium]MBS1758264.1 hypothetical protein [Bacteroidota bacterium]
MKKLVILFMMFCMMMMLGGCFIGRMFHKKEKLGCPNDARGMSEEQINKRANKHKFRAGNKIY